MSNIAAALHIGINQYKYPYQLSKCVADARGFRKLFNGMLLTNRKATPFGILTSLRKTVRLAEKGQWAIVTYSGHGVPVEDRNGDEPDGYDEAIVAVNMQPVLDDEVHSMLKQRGRGGRVLLVADSCYSGAIHRSMPLLSASDSNAIKQQKIRQIPSSAIVSREGTVENKGKQGPISGVVLISGCTDFEYSYEGPKNGVLTGALLQTYEPGLTIRNWFLNALNIVEKSRYPQHPQLVCSKDAEKWEVPEL